MNSDPRAKDATPLPGALNDLPRMRFTRQPAKSGPEYAADNVVFGATSISDAIRRGSAMREAKQKKPQP